ncbi:MAG: hypothetical protein ACOCXG_02615 [Nanoarchaeota archaeon]
MGYDTEIGLEGIITQEDIEDLFNSIEKGKLDESLTGVIEKVQSGTRAIGRDNPRRSQVLRAISSKVTELYNPPSFLNFKRTVNLIAISALTTFYLILAYKNSQDINYVPKVSPRNTFSNSLTYQYLVPVVKNDNLIGINYLGQIYHFAEDKQSGELSIVKKGEENKNGF